MTARKLLVTSCLVLAACAPDVRRGDDGTGGGGNPGGGGDGGDAPGIPSAPPIPMPAFPPPPGAGHAAAVPRTVLEPLHDAENDITIEFHHFTIGSDIKCIYAPTATGLCQNLTMSSTPTPQDVVAEFDQHAWNDYTQVWILSGSEQDQSDIRV